MTTTLELTARSILERAAAEIAQGTLPERWSDHGPYCPWCAIAKAKGDIERELGLSTLLSMMDQYDLPMFEAKWALGDTSPDVLAQDDALMLLRNALEAL